MGWFSPVKGSYPSLAQVDKTLPVKSGVNSIKRGTIVSLKTDPDGKSAEGVFDVAAATDKLLYVSLQDYTDPTAGFAGSAFNPDGGVPRITALTLDQDGEYETSEFDTTATYAIGDALKVGTNGVITKLGSGDTTSTVVGYVTAPKTERWINNAIAAPSGISDQRLAVRTGANANVLRFRTK